MKSTDGSSPYALICVEMTTYYGTVCL